MLLRRSIEHVKAQNWTAVGLDLVIVVLGVFIAIQADALNQRRIESENDHQVLALFVEEVQQMLDLAEEDVASAEQRLNNVGRASQIALKCNPSDAERALLLDSVASILDWRIPNVMPSGLAEISKPGILARLDNLDFTRAVGRLNENVAFMTYANELAVPQYELAMEMLVPHVVLAAPLLSEEGVTARSYDPTLAALDLLPAQELCNSQQFKTGLLVLTTYNQDVFYYFNQWRNSLIDALRLAKQVLSD
jgi:hypothetical protein